MNDEFNSLVGAPEARLRRVKGKPAKADILHRLQNGDLAPEQSLRGYLAIGRTPPTELLSEVNISKALQISDRVAFLSLLSRKLPTVYGDEAVASILSDLRKFRTAKVEAIAAALARIVARWFANGNKVRVAPSTSNRVIAIVEILTRRIGPDHKARSSTLSRNEKALKSLARAAIIWGSDSSDFETILRTLDIVAWNEERFGATLAPEGDDIPFQSAVQRLFSSAHSKLGYLAEAGDEKNLEALFRSLERFPSSSQQLKTEVEQLYGIAARYQKNVQLALSRMTGIAQAESSPVLQIGAADPEALHVTQLASALVRAWSAREEGPKTNEAYEELRVVLADFFGIEIKGSVGSVETFNSRVHEVQLGDKPSGRVRLIRPWVQMSDSQTSKILIKALVTAVD